LNGRKQEAETIMRKAAKKNNIVLPDNIFGDNVDDGANEAEMESLFNEKEEDTVIYDGRIHTENDASSRDSIQAKVVSDSDGIISPISSEMSNISGFNTNGLLTDSRSMRDFGSSVLNNKNSDRSRRDNKEPPIIRYRFSELMRSKSICRYSVVFFLIW
jgi:hypothetical protein